jgi:hypothetical protein
MPHTTLAYLHIIILFIAGVHDDDDIYFLQTKTDACTNCYHQCALLVGENAIFSNQFPKRIIINFSQFNQE